MKKILYMAALLLVVSCGVARRSAEAVKESAAVSDTSETKLVAVPTPGKLWGKTYGDYVFHDDFYYASGLNLKSTLLISPDHYYLIVEYAYKDEVEKMLNHQGFTIVRKSDKYSYPLDGNPQCYDLVVKGEGAVSNIPHLIYANHMYTDGVKPDVFGALSDFSVEFDGGEAQMDKLLELAGQHNLIPIEHTVGITGIHRYNFKCSIYSLGNPTEMANWFVEVAGFPDAHANYSDQHVYIEN